MTMPNNDRSGQVPIFTIGATKFTYKKVVSVVTAFVTIATVVKKSKLRATTVVKACTVFYHLNCFKNRRHKGRDFLC